jgi:3-isopropylmalate/(R)-2-methylmalate dehydratase small subunit
LDAFGVLRSPAVLLDLGPVDTDQIIPARFIKHPRGPDYRRYLFHDRRFLADGTPRPDFPLTSDSAGVVRILASTGAFGVGSAREGAVWALAEFGIRAVLAPSFGDVFYGNCIRNRVLPVTLAAKDLLRLTTLGSGAHLTVDLAGREVVLPSGERIAFAIDAFDKAMLANGVDEIGLTGRYLAEIAAFEARYEAEAAARSPPITPAALERLKRIR